MSPPWDSWASKPAPEAPVSTPPADAPVIIAPAATGNARMASSIKAATFAYDGNPSIPGMYTLSATFSRIEAMRSLILNPGVFATSNLALEYTLAPGNLAFKAYRQSLKALLSSRLMIPVFLYDAGSIPARFIAKISGSAWKDLIISL